MKPLNQEETLGYISAIETMGLVDGPGIRMVVFLQGCPLRCLHCHNPETQGPVKQKGVPSISPSDLVSKALRYKAYFDRTGGGVTFSGGEPLMQVDFLLAATQALKAVGISVAIDTSGFLSATTGHSTSNSTSIATSRLKTLLALVDLVILDVKATSVADHMRLTGASLQGLLNFMDLAAQAKTPLWIRHVMVPGLSDSQRAMEALAAFITPVKKYVEKVEILPYHLYGNEKYSQINKPNPMQDVPAMDKEIAKGLETYVNCLIQQTECHYAKYLPTTSEAL